MTTKRTSEKGDPTPSIDNNLIVLSVGYSSFVLPHETGMRIMDAFRQAEKVDVDYDGYVKKIEPMKPDFIKFQFLSDNAYKERKMEILLGG